MEAPEKGVHSGLFCSFWQILD